MAQLLAAGLEMRLRAPVGAWHAAARSGAVGQARGRVQHVPHVLGVGLPVGGAVQATTRAQLACDQGGEGRLYQPALVVALLVPRIRKVDADFVQRAIGDFVLGAFQIENALVKKAVKAYEPRMIASLQKFAVAVRVDAQHPLRQRIAGWIADSALHLKADPHWQETVRRYQLQLIASDTVQAMLGDVWNNIRTRLLADLHADRPVLAQAIASLARNTGKVLAEDRSAREWLNDAIVAGSGSLVRRYRGEVGAFIAARLDLWSKDEMSERIELAIGRDLQFIRINGTIVGGLAGLLIYAVSHAF